MSKRSSSRMNWSNLSSISKEIQAICFKCFNITRAKWAKIVSTSSQAFLILYPKSHKRSCLGSKRFLHVLSKLQINLSFLQHRLRTKRLTKTLTTSLRLKMSNNWSIRLTMWRKTPSIRILRREIHKKIRTKWRGICWTGPTHKILISFSWTLLCWVKDKRKVRTWILPNRNNPSKAFRRSRERPGRILKIESYPTVEKYSSVGRYKTRLTFWTRFNKEAQGFDFLHKLIFFEM